MNDNLKLLTFVGLGDLQPVMYKSEWGDFKTELFPEAIDRWLQPSEIIALVTPKAKTGDNWKKLAARLPQTKEVGIPNGNTPEELWEIFSQMTKSFDEGDEIIFDITHAFRSIPMLALLSASFLRVAKGVRLKAILYGAYAVDDKPKEAPVFNLTPFVSLLDWITATDKFVKSGDSRESAKILSEIHQSLWIEAKGQKNADLPRQMQGLGAILIRLSQALSLTRPQEISDLSGRLEEKIKLAAGETEKWAKPFTLLLDKAANEFRPFKIESLGTQRAMIRWFVEHEQIAQAITLAREWMVGWTGHQINRKDLQDRKKVEDAVNQASRRKQGKYIDDESPFLNSVENLPHSGVMLSIWDKIRDLRNDVAHCGMRENPRDAADIVKGVKSAVNELENLPI